MLWTSRLSCPSEHWTTKKLSAVCYHGNSTCYQDWAWLRPWARQLNVTKPGISTPGNFHLEKRNRTVLYSIGWCKVSSRYVGPGRVSSPQKMLNKQELVLLTSQYRISSRSNLFFIRRCIWPEISFNVQMTIGQQVKPTQNQKHWIHLPTGDNCHEQTHLNLLAP